MPKLILYTWLGQNSVRYALALRSDTFSEPEVCIEEGSTHGTCLALFAQALPTALVVPPSPSSMSHRGG